MSWLEEANFQMLRDHQCALVWVDLLSHGHSAATVRRYRPCRPAAITPIAGVKEQGVYLSTLTAEYPPSLALQLAQIGIGRQVKQVRLALPLHSNCPSTVTLAPCRLPTCDGAGMHSSADWCLPKPEHPLQAVARPWLHWMHERKLVPRILAHVNSGSSNCPLYPSPKQGSHTDPTCCMPWPNLGVTRTWPSFHFCSTECRQEPYQPCLQWQQRSQTPCRSRIWKFVKATGRWPKTSQKPCKVCCARKLLTTGLLKPALA